MGKDIEKGKLNREQEFKNLQTEAENLGIEIEGMTRKDLEETIKKKELEGVQKKEGQKGVGKVEEGDRKKEINEILESLKGGPGMSKEEAEKAFKSFRTTPLEILEAFYKKRDRSEESAEFFKKMKEIIDERKEAKEADESFAEAKERLEKEREIKPERIPRFYEGQIREDETRLLNEYTEKFKLDPDKEKNIKDILRKERDERWIEFAVKWFDEHRPQLEKKEGFSSDIEITDNKKAEIAMRNGAFEELRAKKKYKEDRTNVENIYVISADFDKGKDCSIEGQVLVLNTLDKRIEKTKVEIAKMEKAGKPEIEINEKLKELGNLFEYTKELTAKIKGLEGINLEDFAKSKAGLLGDKDFYIEKLIEGRKQGEEFCKKSELLLDEEMTSKRWEAMSDFYKKEKYGKKFEEKIDEIKKRLKEGYPKRMMTVDDEKILALMNAGYNVEEIRLKRFHTLVELKKKDGTKDTVEYKKFSEFVGDKVKKYNQELNNRAEEGLGEEWEEKKKIHDDEVRKIINQEIKAIAGSPEKAEKGIQGLFDRVKGKLIDENLKEGAQKQRKTAEELEKLKKEYEVQGKMKDTHRFMSEIIEGKGGLDKMSGDMEEDPGIIENYLREYQGIDTSGKEIQNFIENQEKEGVFWGETIKSEKGLLDYFVELVKFIFISKKEEENKQKKI